MTSISTFKIKTQLDMSPILRDVGGMVQALQAFEASLQAMVDRQNQEDLDDEDTSSEEE